MRRIRTLSRERILDLKFRYVKRLRCLVADLFIVLLPLALMSPSMTSAFARLPRSKHHHQVVSPATNFSSASTAVPGKPCKPSTVPSELAKLTNRLLLAASWIGNPEMGMNAIIRLGPQLISYLHPSPLPIAQGWRGAKLLDLGWRV